ncbi:hypothetical protein Y1Q_0022502 [Alligator mississippiensis]|uniref:Reverse transcriptase/retrotransposon-derived protein RNase H-like domain-containing protein n=1 Tax=Alligator mississippiensis TaxID=8496 RepID=A0A151N0Q2_ALLMI|nr:hypothetical protein Y1Q_0022502 [Alligator mississippiensis]
MEDPDLATYASMQAAAIGPADVLGQNLQALTQILNSQQQMLDRQQDWLQHSLASFKMPKMTKDDDLEAYIEVFEQHALMTRLNKRYWASQLGALVVGKAQATYQALSRDDAQDYEHVKDAILYRLEINPEHYRCQFRAKKGPEEKRPRVLLQLLRDLLDKWTDTSETVVGAVLTQEEGENERPVAYTSRKLLPAEKRYTTIERECLAIWWAVDHFRHSLYSNQ